MNQHFEAKKAKCKNDELWMHKDEIRDQNS